jgi:hypothetical protein
MDTQRASFRQRLQTKGARGIEPCPRFRCSPLNRRAESSPTGDCRRDRGRLFPFDQELLAEVDER